VSCVVGLTVLDVLEKEGLQENALAIGDHLKGRINEMANRHELIGTVHGSGLYMGIELVRDRTTLEPAAEETAAICERMRELGVIVQPTGDRQNVLKVKPPMCITRESADFFVDMLDRVLTTGF
jgi:4-aminobutyrate aminotransferase-like enzyme